MTVKLLRDQHIDWLMQCFSDSFAANQQKAFDILTSLPVDILFKVIYSKYNDIRYTQSHLDYLDHNKYV